MNQLPYRRLIFDRGHGTLLPDPVEQIIDVSVSSDEPTRSAEVGTAAERPSSLLEVDHPIFVSLTDTPENPPAQTIPSTSADLPASQTQDGASPSGHSVTQGPSPALAAPTLPTSRLYTVPDAASSGAVSASAATPTHLIPTEQEWRQYFRTAVTSTAQLTEASTHGIVPIVQYVSVLGLTWSVPPPLPPP